MENSPRILERQHPSSARSPVARGWIPWRLIAFYLAFTVAWTFVTGLLIHQFLRTPEGAAQAEAYKDWIFVLISTGLLIVLVRRHVAETQSAQEQLTMSEAHYRRLIDTASDAIVVLDLATGRFVRHNLQAERLFGLSAEELARVGPLQVSPEFQPGGQRSAERAAAFLKAAAEGGAPVFEWTHRHRSGRDIPCEIRLLRLPGEGPTMIRGSISDISYRRQAQDALRKSEQQLSLILNNATDMMTLFDVEPGGVFRVSAVNRTYVNAVNAAGFMVSASDLVGRTMQEVNETLYRFPAEYNRLKHERFLTVVSSRQVLAYDDVHDTPAGRCYGETVLTPLLDEQGSCASVLYCSRDVTGQRRAAEALARSEENYRTLFEQASDAIFLFHAEGRLLEVNRRAVQLTGQSREELQQRSLFDVVAAVDHDLVRRSLQQMQRDGVCFGVFSFERKQGASFPGETNAKLLPDGRVLALVRDISERKLAEEQRSRLEKELRQAQKIQAIGTLAGGIAHDFNNILAAILGNAQLLKLTLAPAHEGHANVSQILVASHRAKDLVQQILLFSRQREQSRQVLNLEPLLNEAVKLITVSLPPTIRLALTVAPQLPSILADPTQIHQVVVNLCTNALHAMRRSGGELLVAANPVLLPEENSQSKPNLPPGRYVCLAVADTGHGMDAETVERIYEPFFTTKPVGEGTGLGLAVVHGIVQSNDGAISVVSEPGKGTVFKLYFPAREPRPGTTHPWTPAPAKQGQGQHIVFVDDEVSIAQVAKIMVSKLGYRVTAFTNPREALDFLQVDPAPVSLLMTDLSMPGLSGIDVIRGAVERRPTLPAILLTGYGKAFDSATASGLNISEVIHKPFTMEQLSVAIESALRSRP